MDYSPITGCAAHSSYYLSTKNFTIPTTKDCKGIQNIFTVFTTTQGTLPWYVPRLELELEPASLLRDGADRRGQVTTVDIGFTRVGGQPASEIYCHARPQRVFSLPILRPHRPPRPPTRLLATSPGDSPLFTPALSTLAPDPPAQSHIDLDIIPTFLCPPPAMLLSPNADLAPFAQSKRDSSLSPCRASTPLFHRTPPKSASSSLAFTSPMHSPSPLRRQALPTTRLLDEDDVFQSPLRVYSLFPRRSPPGPPDSSVALDEDDDIFLGPSPSSNFIPPSSPAPLRTPLRTPVKDPSRDTFQLSPDRGALSVKHLNVTSAFFSTASAGLKRKPRPICTTPSRSRTMTPLNITSTSGQALGSATAALLFDRLAPLSAPRFASVRETPQTKAETELHLKKQAETMTMLSIRDLDRSDDESGYDSDPDAIHSRSGTIEKQRLLFMASAGGPAAAPFSSIKARTRTKGTIKGKSLGLEVLTRRGLVNDEEVIEAISPGGHVTKRRARSRPVSAELLESVHHTPLASQDKVRCVFCLTWS